MNCPDLNQNKRFEWKFKKIIYDKFEPQTIYKLPFKKLEQFDKEY